MPIIPDDAANISESAWYTLRMQTAGGFLIGVGGQAILVAAGFLLGVLFFVLVVGRVLKIRNQKILNDSKGQFVGLASHYLLTPITIIQTAVARLQESDSSILPEERMRLYDAIQLGEQRLWIVAEQLVLVSELDSNSLKLKIVVAEINELVTSAIASIDVFARKKGVKINFHTNNVEELQTRIDVRRMKQSIIALLDNAIKFSAEGGQIQVTLAYENSFYTIEIADQGVGMNSEVIAKLGEKFYRGSGLYNFDYEGIGLGLYSANAIIRMHQGTITFRSQPSRGTVVTIQFPNL